MTHPDPLPPTPTLWRRIKCFFTTGHAWVFNDIWRNCETNVIAVSCLCVLCGSKLVGRHLPATSRKVK